MLAVSSRTFFQSCLPKARLIAVISHRGMAQSRERVTFPSTNKAGDGAGVLQGDITQTKKGVIVVQEWWGLNEQIQDEAGEIGKLGNYVTLVPDLYRGKVTQDAEEAGHFMGNLDWPGAVADIEGAAKFLLSKGCSKVGVTGFCMGGALSMAAAVLVPQISAAVPFYGIPSPELADVSQIKVPIQCHFGETDDIVGFSSQKDYEALREKLTAAKVNFEFYTYSTGHAFTNPSNPNYNIEFSQTAFARMVAFFNTHLS